MSTAPAPYRPPATRTPLRRRLRRAFGREHNPLCRPCDRARSRLVLATAAFLIAATLCALLAALVVLHRGQGAASTSGHQRHRITATTLTPATGVVASKAGAPVGTEARASWTYPPAHHGTGVVHVAAGTPAGAGVAIWVDDGGRLVAAPRPATEVMTDAVLTGLGTLAVLGATAHLCRSLRGRVLDRRAQDAWEPAWEQIEPLWSGRHHHGPDGTAP
ncbi:hypothetical protein GCM10009665_08530 [Kitasatospora nipponensis]|uniref:Integral membrane protein n=1 Tax=Kitasatospora nipponensis TaxID=258049 RepID=A0ABP4GHJ4_9ACTN